MPVIDRIKDFQNDLVAIRRDIHAHPEIGFEETRTSAIVADLLETWGITVNNHRPKTLFHKPLQWKRTYHLSEYSRVLTRLYFLTPLTRDTPPMARLSII